MTLLNKILGITLILQIAILAIVFWPALAWFGLQSRFGPGVGQKTVADKKRLVSGLAGGDSASWGNE